MVVGSIPAGCVNENLFINSSLTQNQRKSANPRKLALYARNRTIFALKLHTNCMPPWIQRSACHHKEELGCTRKRPEQKITLYSCSAILRSKTPLLRTAARRSYPPRLALPEYPIPSGASARPSESHVSPSPKCLRTYPRLSRRRAVATAATAQLMRRRDVQAARAWYYAKLAHEIPRDEPMPRTVLGLRARLTEVGSFYVRKF